MLVVVLEMCSRGKAGGRAATSRQQIRIGCCTLRFALRHSSHPLVLRVVNLSASGHNRHPSITPLSINQHCAAVTKCPRLYAPAGFLA